MSSRVVFRSDAVERYLRGHDESTVPRTALPRTLVYLWLALLLLLIAGSVIAIALESKL